MTSDVIYVGKLVLLPMSAENTKLNYLISQSKSARFEWSAFAGCFPKPSGDLHVRCGAVMKLW